MGFTLLAHLVQNILPVGMHEMTQLIRFLTLHSCLLTLAKWPSVILPLQLSVMDYLLIREFAVNYYYYLLIPSGAIWTLNSPVHTYQCCPPGLYQRLWFSCDCKFCLSYNHVFLSLSITIRMMMIDDDKLSSSIIIVRIVIVINLNNPIPLVSSIKYLGVYIHYFS